MNLSFFLLLVQAFVLSLAKFSPFDSPEFCSQIITPTCNTTFSFIDEINSNIRGTLVNLVETPFLRYFKLDLEKQCKFWDAQHFCATRNCAVEILPQEEYNWSELPDELRPNRLGEIQQGPASQEHSTCEDLDYFEVDEGHDCVYVDLLQNPERFTGYGGSQSFDVWRAIYAENCFPNTNPMLMLPEGEPEQCIEKNLFYRLISGMHALIAVHLSNEYLDPRTEEFGPNLRLFMERVGKFNDRLSNIYFNYALVSQAIVKLLELVSLPDKIREDSETLASAGNLVDSAKYGAWIESLTSSLGSETLFDTSRLFDPAVVEPELKAEFRARFRNVSAIMDCVGCDRCRMWGKLQTIGYGTALKILFDSEDPETQHLLKFRRIELVALFNTLDRLSKSVSAINNFKKLYLQHLEAVAAGTAKPGEFEPLHDRGIEFPFVAFDKPKSSENEEEVVDARSQQEIEADGGQIYNSNTEVQSFMAELLNVMDAAKFVVNAYVTFPKTVWNFVLYHLNGWWNVYIGRSVYVPNTLKTDLGDEL